MRHRTPVIFVERSVQLKALDEVWIGQIGTAIGDGVSMVALDSRNS